MLDENGVTVDRVGDRTWGRLGDVRSTVTVPLDTLRARLAVAEGTQLLQRRRWDEAARAFDRAIALAPSFEDAYVQRAAARLALHQTAAAVASVAPIAARDPVWLYWKVMADPALAGLRKLPVLTQLEAGTPGSFDASSRGLYCDPSRRQLGCAMGVAEEPSGRFVVAFAEWIPSELSGMEYFTGLEVIDRRLGRVIATIPFDSRENNGHSEGFLAAQKMLRALGFVPPQGEAATVTYLDLPDRGTFVHPVITFPRSGHVLALAGDRGAVGSPRRFVAIAPPGKAISAAVRIGDFFLYRWGESSAGDVVIVPVPPTP
jgi:hypothetical protein